MTRGLLLNLWAASHRRMVCSQFVHGHMLEGKHKARRRKNGALSRDIDNIKSIGNVFPGVLNHKDTSRQATKVVLLHKLLGQSSVQTEHMPCSSKRHHYQPANTQRSGNN